MKPSLEEERRVLLAQIEASRAVYRRMLTGEPPVSADTDSRVIHNAHATSQWTSATGFPRSRSMQWIISHPVGVAAGVALLVWAAPRWWASRSHQHRVKTVREQDVVHERRQPASQGTARALLTASALLLRNPATMRTLSRAAGTVWQWLQQRREQNRTSARTSANPRQLH